MKLNLGGRVLCVVGDKKLYCFAKQRGPQQASALKTMCTNLEGMVRSFIVVIQGGCDQLMDIL